MTSAMMTSAAASQRNKNSWKAPRGMRWRVRREKILLMGRKPPQKIIIKRPRNSKKEEVLLLQLEQQSSSSSWRAPLGVRVAEKANRSKVAGRRISSSRSNSSSCSSKINKRLVKVFKTCRRVGRWAREKKKGISVKLVGSKVGVVGMVVGRKSSKSSRSRSSSREGRVVGLLRRRWERLRKLLGS